MAEATREFDWREASAPLAVAVGLALAFWTAHLLLLDAGGLRIYDEFHTLDRSTAFALHGDWLTVRSFQEPSFRKPPLQYWMTGLLLETGMDRLLALRLPSMTFGLLCLAATGLLAAAVMPGRPWVIPASVLLFSGSLQFWQFGLSGMLETGAVGFATLALAAAVIAVRRPLWWYACAAAIALGALQKAPIGLVLVALYLWGLSLTRSRHGIGFRVVRADPHFRVAFWVAVAGSLAWPLLHTALYGPQALAEFFGRQMLERFAPAGPITDPRTAAEIYDLIIVGEHVLRWLGIAALAWLPWRLGRMELLPLPFVGGVVIAGIVLASGHVTDRYALAIVPLLSVALAGVILSLLSRAILALGAVAAVSAASLGPVKTESALALETPSGYRAQIDALSAAGAALGPEETLVVCTRSGPRRIVPALSSVFASNGRPYVQIDGISRLEGHLAAGRLDGPLRGVCTRADLGFFAPRLVGLDVVRELPGYVMWTAERAR